MSMKLTAMAMDVKVGSPLRKLVLLKLCDNANDKGECWPSFQHIADQCEITRRSVITHVKALQEAGFLRVVHRGRGEHQTSNKYLVSLHPVAPAPAHESANETPSDIRGGGENNSPPPSENNSLPSESISPPPSENRSPGTSHSLEPVSEPKKTLQKKSVDQVGGSSRGSRLPDDWVLPDDWADDISRIDPRLAPRVDSIEAKFRDYWVSLSGARAVKRDWRATWRNWVRNESERLPRSGRPPPGGPGFSGPGRGGAPMTGGESTRERSIQQDLADRSWGR